MFRIPHDKGSIRRGILAATLLVIVLLPAPASQASQRIVDGIDHFADCARLLFSDPAAHGRQCGPSRVPQNFDSLLTPTIEAPAAPAVAPPPAPPAPTPAPPVGCASMEAPLQARAWRYQVAVLTPARPPASRILVAIAVGCPT